MIKHSVPVIISNSIKSDLLVTETSNILYKKCIKIKHIDDFSEHKVNIVEYKPTTAPYFEKV
jgi:hypothetical protein